MPTKTYGCVHCKTFNDIYCEADAFIIPICLECGRPMHHMQEEPIRPKKFKIIIEKEKKPRKRKEK